MARHPEVPAVRRASRDVIRELGFLQTAYTPAGLPHSHCHAMVELGQGDLGLGELAERLRLDKSTTSRVAEKLVARGWAKLKKHASDERRRLLSLTPAGKKRLAEIDQIADQRVDSALGALAPADRAAALRGLQLYAHALARSRARARYLIRPVRKKDNPGVARLIRTVMPEFGASGPGFAILDPEVDDMFSAYRGERAAYFVVVEGDDVVGGGGVAPLAGGDGSTCELRKMYFLPDVRGLGIGQELMDLCLEAARARGFTRCYLETLAGMDRAQALYARNGFQPLCAPEGATGHFGCDRWFARPL